MLRMFKIQPMSNTYFLKFLNVSKSFTITQMTQNDTKQFLEPLLTSERSKIKGTLYHSTELRFSIFISGGFITAIVVNP